jgi:thioredoxin reductase/bacterioferritin-associated ferredoxin
MPDNDKRGSKERESVRRGRDLSLTFEGAEICCADGTTVAGALVAGNVREFRESAGGNRGLFCGMGVCHECLVTIDGVPGYRACMTRATNGMRINRQPLRIALRSTVQSRPDGRPAATVETPQVLVVGGGPAGLSAAITAAEAGAEVVLLDERGNAGGQYFKQPAAPPVPSLERDRQVADGRRLIERARQAGVDIRSKSIVWGGFNGPEIHVLGNRGPVVLRPDTLIVATGASERGHAVPGWTLPGVMTTGAAQSLLRVSGVTPPGRILVAGNGPLNLQVALELSRAGAEVAGVVELAPRPGLRRGGAAVRMLLASSRLTLAGGGMVAALQWRRVPLFYSRAIGQVVREDGALAVELVSADLPNSEVVRLNVDAVCLGYGFHPDNELLRLLGCGHDYDAQRDQLVTRRDVDCRTTVTGIFAVGDCAQTNGAAVAAAEGVIAGLAAARDCGFAGDERTERAARRELLRHRRFQSALWSLFAPEGTFAVPTMPDTLVCRCEDVTSASLDAAIEAGCTSLGAVKRKTRLGMGPCQGRYCVPVAVSRLARHGGRPPGALDRAAPRPPLRPLRLRELGAGRADD